MAQKSSNSSWALSSRLLSERQKTLMELADSDGAESGDGRADGRGRTDGRETTQKCVEFVKTEDREEKRRDDGTTREGLRFLVFPVFPPSRTGRNCRYFRHFPNGRVDKLWWRHWRPVKFPGRERKTHK